MKFSDKYIEIRPSGTDAKTKAYGAGSDKGNISEFAKLLADSYTSAGQNTPYFYKWDVVGTKVLKPGKTQTVNFFKINNNSTIDIFAECTLYCRN